MHFLVFEKLLKCSVHLLLIFFSVTMMPLHSMHIQAGHLVFELHLTSSPLQMFSDHVNSKYCRFLYVFNILSTYIVQLRIPKRYIYPLQASRTTLHCVGNVGRDKSLFLGTAVFRKETDHCCQDVLVAEFINYLDS